MIAARMPGTDSDGVAPSEELEALRASLERAKLRERSLVAVLESARDLAATRDVDQVLASIVARARQLVGAHLAFLASIDGESGRFHMRATDGAVSQRLPRLTLDRGFGMISLIAASGVPYQTSGYGRDGRFVHNPEVDSIFAEEQIDSLLGLPVPLGTELVGMLYVGDRYSRTYLGWEIAMLSTLAAHAAVAIQNARAFEDKGAALRRAHDANALLEQQAAGIRLAAESHEELTALVAKGGGPEEIARVLARRLRGAVLILDEGGQTVAAGAPPAPAGEEGAEGARREPLARFEQCREAVRAAVRESRGAAHSVEVAGAAGATCRVVAVVGGSGILGGMAIWTPAPLDDFAIRIFERSANVTGVVLLSQERLEMEASRDRMAILRGLLSWHQDDLQRLVARAARHGVDLKGHVLLAALEVVESRASYVLRQLRTCSGLETALLDEIDGLVVVLGVGATTQGLRDALEERLRGLGRQVTGVVSDPVARLAELPRVYQSLRRCLGLLGGLERTGAIAAEAELRPYAVVFERQGPDELGAFLEATVGKLLEADRKRGSMLADTLLAYLDHEHNARKTATALGIHVNTLRQRFEQIDDLLGDWRAGARVLDIHLALRLCELRKGPRR
jgi:sugar diacid utilization regulator